MLNYRMAKLAAGTALALSLALGGLAQPMAQWGSAAPQVPDKLPELIGAIAAELSALWDKVGEMPALKDALAEPMALAKEALESLNKEGEEPGERALRDLVVLSLALHRIEDIFERGLGRRVQAHLRDVEPGAAYGPARGPMGRRPAVGTGRFEDVRDWVEAYLKGAMSALSPEEAEKLRGIVMGLVQGMREEFAPERGRARPGPEAMGFERDILGHVLEIKALSARLDAFLIHILTAEAPTG